MKIVACPHLGRFIFPVSTSRTQKIRVARLFCSGLLVVLASACPVAHAQANFSWAQTTIGSGLQNAAGVAVDEVGNVYIADGAHNRVLKETPSGGSYIQTTVVSGLNTPVGLAVDGGGNVYTSTGGNQVVKETLSGGSYTQTVVASSLSNPNSLAVDGSGNVFIVDVNNHRVLKETPSGGSYTETTIGSGLSTPSGVAVDGSGNVYIIDIGANQMVKETLSGGTYTQTSISFATGFINDTGSIAVDPSGNIYLAVSDSVNNNYVFKGVPTGGSAAPTVGSGFLGVYGVAVDGKGNVYIADSGSSRVLKVQTNAVDFGTVNVGSTSAAIAVTFSFGGGTSLDGLPSVLTLGATGLDFADASTGTCSATGNYGTGFTCTVDVTFTPKYPGQRLGAVRLTNVGPPGLSTGAHIYGTGTGPLVTFPSNTRANTIGSGFLGPYGVAVDGSGNVFVADNDHSAVKEIVAVGGVVSSSSTVNTIGSGFNQPTGVAVDGNGNVFVADTGNNAVKEIVAVDGVVSSSSDMNVVGSGFNQPTGVAVDGSGNVFVADRGSSAVKEVVADSGLPSSFWTVNTIGSGFSGPYGVAVDGAGNVFVADTGNNAVKEIVAVGGVVSSSSTVNTIGSGFSSPTGVAVDASGNVFVADTGNNVVKEIVAVNGVVSSNSTVDTVGSGIATPVGVAVDGSGNVFVGDIGNNAVKEIDLSNPPSLSFPTATNVGSTDTTDGPQTVTMANSGNAALTFTVPASGDNPSISADFTLDSTSGGTCPLTTGTPNTLAAGARCTLPVSFAPTVGGAIGGSLVLSDTNLNANPSTTQTISLNGTGLLLTPTLGFATIPAHTYGDTPFIVTASSLSSGAVTYTVASGPATISGSTVTLTGAGTVVLSASQAATTTYAAATASTSFVVGQITPTLIFVTVPHIYGDAPFSVSATSASSGVVTYAVLSGPATISGNTVTLTGAGTVVLSASQAATATYTTATATASFTVDQTPSTLTFAAIPAHIYGDAPFSVSATSASSGMVTYAVLSGPATISGNTVTLTGSGIVVLSASQSATTTYAAATATTSFTVGRITPTLAFAAIPAHTYGDTPFIVTATSASPGAVTYTVVSGPATISGNTVTLTGVGTVVLSASQAATAVYGAGTATTSFTVGQAPPSDFSLGTTGTSSTQSIAAGGTATFSFSLAPAGGAYPGAVSFTATGLPAGATATFSPASIAANGGAQTVTLTVKTTTQAKLDMPVSPRGGMVVFALLFLPLAGTRRMRRVTRKLGRGTGVALLLLLSLGAVAGLSGCGGDGSHSSPTAKSYTIAVTATSGSAQHTTNFTLQVQ